jgi:hypothetical protein
MASVAESQTAAASFLSIRRYIETTYGQGSFRRVRDIVAETHPEFPQILTPGATYPTVWLFATIEAAHDLLGPEEFYESCGDAIVDYEVNVLFRFALKFSSPNWVFDRATEAWRKAHTTGSWVMAGRPGHLVARLVDFTTTIGYCRLLGAYFVRLLSLSGAQGVTVEHPGCAARGDGECTFVSRWRER